MAIFDRHRQYRSDTIQYFNGAVIELFHGWEDFDPEINNYRIDLHGICTSNNRGYAPGSLIEITRGFTYTIDTEKISLKIRSNGLLAVRRDGNNQNEATLNSNSWQIYLQGERVN